MNLKTVKEMILNVIDSNPRGYSNILAEVAGYSTGTNLTRVLTGEGKEFENFNGLLKLVSYIWPKDTVKLMVQYSNEVDPNKKTARNLLEYFVSNAQYEAFYNLLNRMEECKNKESLEYAKIYRMQYKYQPLLSSDSNEFSKLIQEISEIHVTFPELKVYKKILINYCCYLTQDYNNLKVLLYQIEEEMELIENDFIKEMYMIRVNEVKAYTYLKAFNDPETARECCDWIINSSAAIGFKAHAYYLKGHSYMFTSLENAMECYEKAIQFYDGRHQDIEEIKEEIEFVKVYWDKEVKNNYIKSKLFYEVKKGNVVSLDEYNLTTEFKLYLEGYSTKDNNKLLLSMINYIKNKDLFLANLAKIELIKNGYNQDIISAMVSMNVA